MKAVDQQALREDLSKKLQVRLGEVLKCDINIAHHVLDAHQTGLLLVEAAVMMMRTVSATVATLGEKTGAIEPLYDATVQAIVKEVARSRPDALKRIRAELAERPTSS